MPPHLRPAQDFFSRAEAGGPLSGAGEFFLEKVTALEENTREP
jgi:hypothetical protein